MAHHGQLPAETGMDVDFLTGFGSFLLVQKGRWSLSISECECGALGTYRLRQPYRLQTGNKQGRNLRCTLCVPFLADSKNSSLGRLQPSKPPHFLVT